MYIYGNVYHSIVPRKYFRQDLGRKSGQILPSIIFYSKILLFMRKREKKRQDDIVVFPLQRWLRERAAM